METYATRPKETLSSAHTAQQTLKTPQTGAITPSPVTWQANSFRLPSVFGNPAGVLRVQQLKGNREVGHMLAVQQSAEAQGLREPSDETIRSAAAEGVRTPAMMLPFLDRIQASFGRHSIGHIKAHVGLEAAQASRAMNALAFASGDHVVFGGMPDLRTAAHEAAHVVQQQAGVQLVGDLGREGDAYERHADAVADAVTAGKSAEDLLEPFAAAPTVGTNGVQRYVQVGTVSNLEIIWYFVKDLLESVWGRKKRLAQLAEDNSAYLFHSYEALANALDSSFLKPKKIERARPEWANGIKNGLKDTWGGKRHRRHIIMSSLIRDAVYSVTDGGLYDEGEKRDVYNEISASAGFGYKSSLLAEAEYILVYVLHNNPANLVLDSGSENIAIGMLAHSFGEILKNPQPEFDKYVVEGPDKYFVSKIKGFGTAVQAGIIDDVRKFPQPGNLEEFVDLLEMLYDSTAFDLLTKEKMPSWVSQLTPLHAGFVGARDKHDLKLLEMTAKEFVELGNKYGSPKYKTIWW